MHPSRTIRTFRTTFALLWLASAAGRTPSIAITAMALALGRLCRTHGGLKTALRLVAEAAQP